MGINVYNRINSFSGPADNIKYYYLPSSNPFYETNIIFSSLHFIVCL